jgi:NADH:ubiquinone oxidoreductase subunit F (NADH-binding)
MLYVQASEPPFTAQTSPPRRSPWRSAVIEARTNRGQWMKVQRPLAEYSAQQTASDVRNAARRGNTRFGIASWEKWETTHGEVGDEWFVWIRFREGAAPTPF